MNVNIHKYVVWLGGLKKLNPAVGLLLVVIGVLMLAIGYMTRLVHCNAVLVAAFVLIAVGVALYVLLQKWQSRY